MHVSGGFCDLEKAFDSVNHELLLYKLEYYGIQRKILDWFKSYLVDRKQRVY
jgi:Reverse transcriptase (RNA-dependent DNA polymerase).